jgi:hypothetical protein
MHQCSSGPTAVPFVSATVKMIFLDETIDFDFKRFLKEYIKTPADCAAFAGAIVLHCVGMKNPGQVLVQSIVRSYAPIRSTSTFTKEWFTPGQQEFLPPAVMERMLHLLQPLSLESLSYSNAGDLKQENVEIACKAIVYNTYNQYGGGGDTDLVTMKRIAFDADQHLLPFMHLFSALFKTITEDLKLHVSRASTATFFGTDATVETPSAENAYFYPVTLHDRNVICGPPVVYHMAIRILSLLDEITDDITTCSKTMPDFQPLWTSLDLHTFKKCLDSSKCLQPSAYAASIGMLLEDQLVQGVVYTHSTDMMVKSPDPSVGANDLVMTSVREIDRPSRLIVLRYMSSRGRA